MSENHSASRPEPSKSSGAESLSTGWRPPRTDRLFVIGLCILGGSYVVFIVAMLAADIYFIAGTNENIAGLLASDEIRYSIFCCGTMSS